MACSNSKTSHSHFAWLCSGTSCAARSCQKPQSGTHGVHGWGSGAAGDHSPPWEEEWGAAEPRVTPSSSSPLENPQAKHKQGWRCGVGSQPSHSCGLSGLGHSHKLGGLCWASSATPAPAAPYDQTSPNAVAILINYKNWVKTRTNTSQYLDILSTDSPKPLSVQ